jgi:uncharacterized membrane protein YvbJ
VFCKNCGEENPDGAVFCRNCGEKLKEDVKKGEIIESPTYQKENEQKTTDSSSSSASDYGWIGCCCLGIIIVFVIAAFL